MPKPSRRAFLGGAGAVAASAGLLAVFHGDASEVAAGAKGRGSLDDVEHVVILMQENRSFDHYYGTMRGVRGFGDPTALTLATGKSALYQPDKQRPDGGFLLPFHVDTTQVDGQDLGDLAHDWATTHEAWNAGRYDQWILAKSDMTMAFFDKGDIPFHRALAEAFTICDSYFCSIQGPTTPNRLFLWSGTIDPDGTAGGPATANPPDYKPVYHWMTYPERLQQAGISWQVFANDEVGDADGSFVGDYGDNSLWLFQAYHDALNSSDPKMRQLADRASLRTSWKPDSGLGMNIDHVIAQFSAACAAGTLPAVSWVVAPYRYCEHPSARPVDGEAYVHGVLSALWAKPSLWAKTVVLINYDENDGFYDHVPPPVPPANTVGEFLPAIQPDFGSGAASGLPTPIGLGPRVPMTVISPWSHGGWVNSQIFDHTSVLRFLEAWTGVKEPNISAWRREICGDLTSCFDFARPSTSIPSLPDTTARRKAADQKQAKLPSPMPPVPGHQIVPVQDSGQLRMRALPYQPLVNFSVTSRGVQVALVNPGEATVPFALYVGQRPDVTATSYDVAASGSSSITVSLDTDSGYEIDVHGPNGFLAHCAGDAASTATGAEIEVAITGTKSHPLLGVTAHTVGATPVILTITQNGKRIAALGGTGGSETATLDPIASAHGWYDFSVALDGHPTYVRRFAGHLENGSDSKTR